MFKTPKPVIILSFALLFVFGLYFYDGLSGLKQIISRLRIVQNIQPIVLGASEASDEILNQDANQADIEVDNQPKPIIDELGWQNCDNYAEEGYFDQPVPIVWTAQLDGCLVGCEGASFTRINENALYPRFAAYVPIGETIPDEYLVKGLILKITGKWLGIDEDHYRTVFNNKCVPIVDIDEIEIVK